MVRYIISALFLILFMSEVSAQNWDYEKYPNRILDFQHLDADLRISESGLIEGDVLYSAIVIAGQPDSLVLHAAGQNILSVEVNNTIADYRMNDHLLIVYPENGLIRGEHVQIRVQYDADPGFGIHINDHGSVWTSNLPNSTQHWLPVFDHPRTTFTFDIAFTHPSDSQVISTGRRGSTDLLSVDEATTIYSSDQKVPATALSWYIGEPRSSVSTVRRSETGIGLQLPTGFERRADPQVTIYSEREDDSLEEILVQTATDFIEVSNYFGLQLPYRDLHVIFMDEDFYELKHYGAGMIYVFRNRGNIEYQIKRGKLAQWAGVLFREEQWQDNDAILLLQAIAYSDIFEHDDQIAHFDKESIPPYNTFSDSNFELWLSNVINGSFTDLVSDIKWIQPELAGQESGILSWFDLAKILYEKSGRNYMEVPQPVPSETDEEGKTHYEYLAKVQWDQTDNRIEIFFESKSDPVDELVTVELVEVTFSETRKHEISFSGERDGVVVSVSPALEYVKLNVVDRDDIILRSEKPYLFWITLLREDEDVENRVEAAKALAGISGNPDLQLAINDLLQVETNPVVYSEMIRSLGYLTAGASGTDERFIRYSSNQEHLLVQKAATEALSNYQGNDRVINRLRNIIIQARDAELRKSAIRSLANVTESDDFLSYIQNLILRDELLNQVPFMLHKLAKKGEAESAVEMSETFITAGFPYQIRIDVLDFLDQYDNSSDSWNKRLQELMADRHPGIRLAAAKSLHKLTSQQRSQISDTFINEEFDARVIHLLSR